MSNLQLLNVYCLPLPKSQLLYVSISFSHSSETDYLHIKNAFSALSKFGFDYHSMLVVDFMHEFELGVWKALYKHLIRILFAHGGSAISAFNERFRSVPTFGRSTIRRFTENASAMKKLAARDYEDLLQVRNFRPALL